MRKLIWVLSLLACCASASLGQAAQEYPKNELFVGYSFNTNDSQLVPPASAGDDSLNGFDIAYTRNINKVVGVTVDLSGHFNQEGFQTDGTSTCPAPLCPPGVAGEFDSTTQLYNLLGGLQLKARNQSRVTPFVHALMGVSHYRFNSDFRAATANTFVSNPATSFGMALGGGLDVRVNDKIDLRLFQLDYNPTFLVNDRQDNFRFSVGVIFKK